MMKKTHILLSISILCMIIFLCIALFTAYKVGVYGFYIVGYMFMASFFDNISRRIMSNDQLAELKSSFSQRTQNQFSKTQEKLASMVKQ